jgi:predicted dehydrogenase/threonine dehydrogenase-like Zn-dependent dehydrogenase
MLQITQNYKTGELRIEEVPIPILKAGGLLVENRYSLISSGTEKATIDVSRKGLIGKAKDRPEQLGQVMDSVKRNGLIATYKTVMDRLNLPVPLGYSCGGTVRDVSEDVNEFTTGDKIACAGGGYASHAEVVFVPKHLCARVPDGVSLDAAAFTTVGAIAIQGVRQAQVQIGEAVAVIGLGLVGLLTVQILKAAGCSVLGVDVDASKFQIASAVGADVVALAEGSEVEDIALGFSKCRGVDAVVITAATSSSDTIVLAGRILRDRGKVVVVGSVGMDIPRKDYYEKELELRLSRSYGPGRYDPLYEEKGIDYPLGYVRWTEKRNMEAFLDLLAKGKIDVDRLITHKFEIEDAERAYEVILGKTEEHPIGVLLEYSGEVDLKKSKVILATEDVKERTKASGDVKLGIIGAGNFARSFLLPSLKDNNSVFLKGVATGSGINSKHVARKFGFQYCTTDYNDILNDPEVSAVVIATRHNLHAKLAIEAMKKHKAVFVEKPLALNEDELAEVIETWKDNEGRLMVGFNRRFSPLVEEVKNFFCNRTEPLAITYRVNAGFVPKDHWIQDPIEGGGRIVGEVCHFVDLVNFITGSNPLRVFAERISADADTIADNDNISLTIKLQDGSLANVAYLANGDTSFPKERVEIFCEGSIAVIDDFRRLQLIRKGRMKRIKKHGQDKGHKNELRMFINALRDGGQMPIPFKDSVTATFLTFLIERSLRERLPIDVDFRQFGF